MIPGDVAVLALLLLVQITVIALPGAGLAALLLAAAVSYLVSRHALRAAVRLMVRFGVLLAMVLLARLIVEPSLTTVGQWLGYAIPLLSAAMIALALVTSWGRTRLALTLSRVFRVIPGPIGRTLGSMARTAVLVLPTVERAMRDARDMARIRLPAGGKAPLRRVRAAVTGTVTAVAAIPRRRAEGMVVRRMVDEGATRWR